MKKAAAQSVFGLHLLSFFLFFFKEQLFIYSAVPGLSYDMQDP